MEYGRNRRSVARGDHAGRRARNISDEATLGEAGKATTSTAWHKPASGKSEEAHRGQQGLLFEHFQDHLQEIVSYLLECLLRELLHIQVALNEAVHEPLRR